MKKITKIFIFTFLLLSMYGLSDNEAKAIYLNVSPSNQTINGYTGTATWNLSWGGGQSYYNVYFRQHNDEKKYNWQLILDKTSKTSYTHSKSYDLPAGKSYVYWYPSFSVQDYWGAYVRKDVQVFQRLYL